MKRKEEEKEEEEEEENEEEGVWGGCPSVIGVEGFPDASYLSCTLLVHSAAYMWWSAEALTFEGPGQRVTLVNHDMPSQLL